MVGNALGVVAQVALVAAGLGAVVAIRHRCDARLALLGHTPKPVSHPVRIGFAVGLTNPKSIFFFVAFLPQFTDPDGPVALQILLLGLAFGVPRRGVGQRVGPGRRTRPGLVRDPAGAARHALDRGRHDDDRARRRDARWPQPRSRR